MNQAEMTSRRVWITLGVIGFLALCLGLVTLVHNPALKEESAAAYLEAQGATLSRDGRTDLDLMESGQAPEGFDAVKAQLHRYVAPDITNVDLADKQVSYGEILALTKFPKLESVSLRNVLVTDEMAQIIGELKTLKYLDLCNTRLTTEGLGRLAGLTNLEALYLDDNNLTDLSAVGTMSSLRTLEMQRVKGISGKLAPLGQLVELRYLFLSETDVVDEDLKELSSLVKLDYLALNRTAVSDLGLPHLAKLSVLRHIQLDRTEITDDGLYQLAPLQELYLAVSNTKVTDEGRKNFARMVKKVDWHDFPAAK